MTEPLTTRAELFKWLRDFVPRVTGVDYQKPNRGYVKVGYVFHATETMLLEAARCTRSDKVQIQELVHVMHWFGFDRHLGGGNWIAVRPRKRGKMFSSSEAKRTHLRQQGYKAVLRFRARKYATELEELDN